MLASLTLSGRSFHALMVEGRKGLKKGYALKCSKYLSIYLSIYLSVRLSIYLSTYQANLSRCLLFRFEKTSDDGLEG